MERWLNRSLGAVAAALLFFMMLLTTVDVVMRYVFNSPIGASFEVTELSLGILIFAALPLVTLKDEHVGIDLIDLVVPPAVIRFMRRIVNLVMAVCLAVLAWRLWLAADRFLSYGDMTATAEIPIYPFYYLMAILSGASALIVLAKVYWLDAGRSSTHEYMPQ